MDEIIYKDEVYKIVGICMEIHRFLGHGFLEVVYKDAMEIEFRNELIDSEREKECPINYKGVILKHRFFGDFILLDKIIVEVKANKEGINNESIAQTLNYLKVSNCKLGLIINFGTSSLEYKRLVLKA
jgi:GxxExxY protein